MKVWERYKDLLEQKTTTTTPWWVAPTEVISIKRTNIEGKWPTYRELLVEREGKLKLKDYHQIREYVYDWLQHCQLNEVFKEDKKKGFGYTISRFQREIVGDDVTFCTVCSILFNLAHQGLTQTPD